MDRAFFLLIFILIASNTRSQSITPTDRVDWVDLSTTERDTIVKLHITQRTEAKLVLKYQALNLISLSRDSLLNLAENSVSSESLSHPISIEERWYDSTGNLHQTYFVDGPDGVITIFEYDSLRKHRTHLFAFYKESDKMLWNHFILYDAQGRAYALRVTDSEANTLDSMAVENCSFGVTSARHFDRTRHVTDAASNEFDKMGRLIGVHRENFISKDRTIVASYMSYDDAGRLLTTLDSTTYLGSGSTVTMGGTVVSMSHDTGDGLFVGKAHYHYDGKGRISNVDWNDNEVENYVYGTDGPDRDSVVQRIRGGKDTLLRTYHRDSEGHVIDEAEFYKGSPFSRIIRAYDKGLLRREIEINPYPRSVVLFTARDFTFGTQDK